MVKFQPKVDDDEDSSISTAEVLSKAALFGSSTIKFAPRVEDSDAQPGPSTPLIVPPPTPAPSQAAPPSQTAASTSASTASTAAATDRLTRAQLESVVRSVCERAEAVLSLMHDRDFDGKNEAALKVLLFSLLLDKKGVHVVSEGRLKEIGKTRAGNVTPRFVDLIVANDPKSPTAVVFLELKYSPLSFCLSVAYEERQDDKGPFWRRKFNFGRDGLFDGIGKWRSGAKGGLPSGLLLLHDFDNFEKRDRYTPWGQYLDSKKVGKRTQHQAKVQPDYKPGEPREVIYDPPSAKPFVTVGNKMESAKIQVRHYRELARESKKVYLKCEGDEPCLDLTRVDDKQFGMMVVYGIGDRIFEAQA